MKTSAEIRKIADEIERVMQEHNIARSDPHAIRRIEFHAGYLAACCTYSWEKARQIATLADRFYSARKHETHRRGAEGVWAEMADLLSRIRSRANYWESLGK